MRLRRLVLALAALALAAPPAQAQFIEPLRWHVFEFNTGGFAGSSSQTCTGPIACTPTDDPPWTFSLDMPFTVTVLDGGRSIDGFSLFTHGVLVGSTSTPVGDVDCGTSVADCLASPNHSRGVFTFGNGFHVFTIQSDIDWGGTGVGFFRVDLAIPSVAPEPATMLLVGAGLAALGVGAARRRTR
jgi:hypothetical protein